jgi:hypothetical protein
MVPVDAHSMAFPVLPNARCACQDVFTVTVVPLAAESERTTTLKRPRLLVSVAIPGLPQSRNSGERSEAIQSLLMKPDTFSMFAIVQERSPKMSMRAFHVASNVTFGMVAWRLISRCTGAVAHPLATKAMITMLLQRMRILLVSGCGIPADGRSVAGIGFAATECGNGPAAALPP